MEKPVVTLSDLMHDGNAIALINVCKRSAQRAGWSKKEFAELIEEMTSQFREQI